MIVCPLTPRYLDTGCPIVDGTVLLLFQEMTAVNDDNGNG